MATIYEERSFIQPDTWPDNAAFWQAANEGRLMVKHCNACGQPHWYPRPLCPFCASADTELRPASGKATVYSVSVTRKAGPQPYAVAYVTLDEGVTMMTNIVDCDLDTVRIGDRVEVVFKSGGGAQAVPMFRPVR